MLPKTAPERPATNTQRYLFAKDGLRNQPLCRALAVSIVDGVLKSTHRRPTPTMVREDPFPKKSRECDTSHTVRCGGVAASSLHQTLDDGPGGEKLQSGAFVPLNTKHFRFRIFMLDYFLRNLAAAPGF